VLCTEYRIVTDVSVERQNWAADLLPLLDAERALKDEASCTEPHLGILGRWALLPTPHPVAIWLTECEGHADLAFDRLQNGLIVAVMRPEGDFSAELLDQADVAHFGIKRNWHRSPCANSLSPDTRIGVGGGYAADQKAGQPRDVVQPDDDETARRQPDTSQSHREPAAGGDRFHHHLAGPHRGADQPSGR